LAEFSSFQVIKFSGYQVVGLSGFRGVRAAFDIGVAPFLLLMNVMKGKSLLLIGLVLIAISFFAPDAPGRIAWMKSVPGLLISVVSRVGGLICLIAGVIRMRQERKAG
jgi:hypothetical protein